MTRHEWRDAEPVTAAGHWQQCATCHEQRYRLPSTPDDGLARDPATDAPIPCHEAVE